MKMRSTICRLGLVTGLALVLAAPAAAQANVMFIFDASGSMRRPAGNETRIAAAKRAFGETLAAMPAHVRTGLIAFGHRKRKDCRDIEIISPVGAGTPGTLANTVAGFDAIGETPIAASIDRAGEAMKAFKGQANTIVLVTDGIEECGGDPCAAAERLVKLGIDVKVHVVGFALGAGQEGALKCIVERTGGRFHDARDVSRLRTALATVRQEVAKAAPKPKPTQVAQAKPASGLVNLLDPKYGGQIVAAPHAKWAKIVTGKEGDYATNGLPAEAVFGFKGGQAATFSAFQLLIVETRGWNIKDFELSVADQLGGPFKPLGKFTTMNTRLFQSPYQEFKFGETTGKFLKFKVLSNYGGGYNYARINQVRIMGRP